MNEDNEEVDDAEDGPSLALTAEGVARRFANDRPGFRLSDYDHVGLPLYRLDIEATFLDAKRISPIDEFILRSIDSGLSTDEEIRSFLGLDHRVVRRSMVNLARSEDIALQAHGDDKRQLLCLTSRGRATKAECERIVPTDHEVFLYFDGLLRKPVGRGSELPLHPRDLREMGIREIPSFPARPPGLEDLQPKAVFDILRTAWAGTKRSRELLAIKSLERRTRFYRRAVALIYRSIEGQEVQVAFAIDGRLSNEHEHAFALHGGPQKTGIAQSVLVRVDTRPAEQFVGPATAAVAATIDDSEKMQSKLEAAEAAAEVAAKAKLEATTADAERAAAQQQQQAERDVEAAKSNIEAQKARMIGVLEHPPLLMEALTTSGKRLVILSPWIRAAVVTELFVRRLEERLRRNVEVYIGYGLGEVHQEDMSPLDRRAEDALQRLLVKYKTFQLKRFGDTHAKVLICDNRFCVASSFNWLSFRGDPKRTFREELGFLIRDPQAVEESFELVRRRFESMRVDGG